MRFHDVLWPSKIFYYVLWFPICQDMIFSNFYFDQFYVHLLNIFPLHRRRFSYDLMISRFTNRTDLLAGMLTDCRTKRGPIKWSLPQRHPLLSPPLHPLHPKPADHDAATHRGDPPVHRRLATSGWRTTNILHLGVPPDSLLTNTGGRGGVTQGVN